MCLHYVYCLIIQINKAYHLFAADYQHVYDIRLLNIFMYIRMCIHSNTSKSINLERLYLQFGCVCVCE